MVNCFQFQVASNFVFPNASTIVPKVEFALIGVGVYIFMLYFSASYLYFRFFEY